MLLRLTAFFAVVALASARHRSCYSCNSKTDCEMTGMGREIQCDMATQCYTLKFNGHVTQKGCTVGCSYLERDTPRLHMCAACTGDRCNTETNAGYVYTGNNQNGNERRKEAKKAKKVPDSSFERLFDFDYMPSDDGIAIDFPQHLVKSVYRHHNRVSKIRRALGEGASPNGGVAPGKADIGGGAAPGKGDAGIGDGVDVVKKGGIGEGVELRSDEEEKKEAIGGGAKPKAVNAQSGAATVGDGAAPNKAGIGEGVELSKDEESIGDGAAPRAALARSGAAAIGGGAAPSKGDAGIGKGVELRDEERIGEGAAIGGGASPRKGVELPNEDSIGRGAVPSKGDTSIGKGVELKKDGGIGTGAEPKDESGDSDSSEIEADPINRRGRTPIGEGAAPSVGIGGGAAPGVGANPVGIGSGVQAGYNPYGASGDLGDGVQTGYNPYKSDAGEGDVVGSGAVSSHQHKHHVKKHHVRRQIGGGVNYNPYGNSGIGGGAQPGSYGSGYGGSYGSGIGSGANPNGGYGSGSYSGGIGSGVQPGYNSGYGSGGYNSGVGSGAGPYNHQHSGRSGCTGIGCGASWNSASSSSLAALLAPLLAVVLRR